MHEDVRVRDGHVKCALKDGAIVEVRRADPGDLEDLRRLRDVPDFIHLARIASQSRGEADYLVAELQRRIVGHLLIIWTGKPTQPDFPDVSDVLVRSGFRRRGIGECLLEAAEIIAKVKGFDKLGLSVNPVDNPRAKRLYERLGYEETGLPYADVTYSWVDADGRKHIYDDWKVDMVKRL